MSNWHRNAIIVLVLLLGGGSAAAQAPVVFTTLEVDLWPDYDRAGVLVIYRGRIAPGVSLPAQLVLRLPAASGPPSAVAELNTDGRLITLPYERRVEGDVAFIETTVTRPAIQFEYYDPAIERSGAERRFSFAWPGDYEVGQLSVSAQQPDLAQNLLTEPPAQTRGPSVDGLVYHTVVFSSLAAGQAATVDVSYEKASDQLSVETMLPSQPAAATAAPTTAPGAVSDTETVVLAMGGLILLAAVIGGIVWIRGRRTSVLGAAASTGGTPRFCTGCGAPAGGDDRFCHGCGKALR